MHTYKVKNEEIVSQNGFPWAPRLFCDNRLMFEVNENAISELRYYAKQGDGHMLVLRKNFYKNFCFYLENSKANYGFLPAETRLMPYGFTAQWPVEGQAFTFSVAAAANSLIVTLKTPPCLPTDYQFKVELRADGFFVPNTSTPEEFCGPLLGGMPRQWQGFEFADNAFTAAYTEEDGAHRNLCFGADYSLFYEKKERNIKYILRSEVLQPSRTYRMVLAVTEGEESARDKCALVLRTADALLAEQKQRYTRLAENLPVLECDNPALADFMAIAPMYTENLKMLDCPGAIRANTKHYKAWGSDSLYRGYSFALWGDNDYNANIIDLAQRLGSPMVCAYNGDCTVNMHATGKFDNTDPVYITHLYAYLVGGGQWDETRYAFAKSIFEHMERLEKDGLGLFDTGTVMHFDYSGDFDSTICDRNMFGIKENGLFYAAVRCMQYLAYRQGDIECMQRAAALAGRFEQNFVRVCFNKELGYFPAATNSTTYEFLPSYCAYLMVYENDYLTDVMEETFAPALAYFKEHYISTNGLRPLAKDHPAYDGDGNQMHAWWPAYNADYYARMVSMLDDEACMRQYIGWITYWSSRITMPEGIDCYDNNPNPDFDYWNQCCGAWNMFSTRAFYQTVVRSVIGLDFDHGGLTVYPRSGKEYTIRNLHMLGRTFDVALQGRGQYVQQIIINGTVLQGTHKIPMDLLREHNQVTVQRAQKPSTPIVLRCVNGGSLTNYRLDGEMLAADVELPGHAVLKLYTDAPVMLTVDNGQPKMLAPDANGKASVCLDLCGKHSVTIRKQA